MNRIEMSVSGRLGLLGFPFGEVESDDGFAHALCMCCVIGKGRLEREEKVVRVFRGVKLEGGRVGGVDSIGVAEDEIVGR